jgi:xylulokinase
MAEAPLLCGIDAGTSRVRVIVFEADGRQIAEASEPTPTKLLGPGEAEHDPEALWQSTLRSLAGAVAKVPKPSRIRGLAVASVGEAGLLVDGQGQPLAAIPAWYDTRTAPDLEKLVERLGFERLHRITGLCPDPTFGLLKLARLRRTEPLAVARAEAWLNVSDYLAWRLGGRRATDYSLASRTMALDLQARRWSGELLAAVDVPSGLMQPLTPSGALLGRIRPEVAAATGLAAEVAIGVGGHDHFCGMLAVGADTPGVMLDSMGSAEALTLVMAAASADAAAGRAGLNQGLIDVEGPLAYVFGGLPTSGAAVEWFRGLWGAGADRAQLMREAAAAPPGSLGTLFLPHLRLGSSPFPDPVSRGAFLGLSDGADRGVLFRAVLEGLALDAAQVMCVMLDRLHLPPPDRIILIGGSTRNELLMRIKASAYGRPVEVAEVSEATCLGAAILGGLAAGLFTDLADARSRLHLDFHVVEPDPEWPEPARAALRRAYAEAQAAVRPLHAALRRAGGGRGSRAEAEIT